MTHNTKDTKVRQRGKGVLQSGMNIGYLKLIDQCSQWNKWNCLCGCGNTVIRTWSSLIRAKKLNALASCGCMWGYRSLDARINKLKEKQVYYTKEISKLLEIKLMLEKQGASDA